MQSFWHPLSSLLLAEPRAFVTDAVLRRIIGRGIDARLIYAGDGMWPAVGHGSDIVVSALSSGPLPEEAAVVVCLDGIPDLARVVAAQGESVRLCRDADPTSFHAPRCQVIAIARVARARTGRIARAARRLALDLREALGEPLDPDREPSGTVMRKYDAQAPFYAREPTFELPPALIAQIRDRIPAGSRVLVAGSGTGRECFRLEREGFAVVGIDFAASMVEVAAREAARRGSQVTFHHTDLRSHQETPGSLGAVLFTYDVYSFLPERSGRIAILRRMARWLAPDGVLLLSARRLRSVYGRLILTLQWLRHRSRHGGSWGDSHTRWIAVDGSLHRSFIHYFTGRALSRELRQAGLAVGPWDGGHCLVRRLP